MAVNMLTPYVPAGSNIITPTMTQQGYMYKATSMAIQDTTPMDNPCWQRLPMQETQPQQEQSFMVDAYQVPSARGTAVAMGALVGQPEATIPTNQVSGKTPYSQSNTNNRGIIKNQLEKRRFPFFIAQETEMQAAKGAIAGGITSEKAREIQRKTKLMMTQIEYDLFTTTAQVVDLQDATTAGVAAGILNLLNTSVSNWVNLGWVANVNVIAGGANGATKTSWRPEKITDVTEKYIQDLLMFCNKSGCDKDMHLFVPDIYHNQITTTWKGRENISVNTQEAAHALDMGFELYKAVSGIRMNIIPNRTQSDETMVLLDLKGWGKRVGIPFGLYNLPQYAPDYGGIGQMSWTVLGDPRRGGCFYTSSAPS